MLLELSFAGHQTSSSTTTRLLWLLPQHPAMLARLRDEQQQAVAQHGQAITDAVLKDCPYLDAVVRESMRAYVSSGSSLDCGCLMMPGNWCLLATLQLPGCLPTAAMALHCSASSECVIVLY